MRYLEQKFNTCNEVCLTITKITKNIIATSVFGLSGGMQCRRKTASSGVNQEVTVDRQQRG